MPEIPQFRKNISDELPRQRSKGFLKSVSLAITSILLALGFSASASATPTTSTTDSEVVSSGKSPQEKTPYLYSQKNPGDYMQLAWHYSHYSHSSHSSHSSHYSHYSSNY